MTSIYGNKVACVIAKNKWTNFIEISFIEFIIKSCIISFYGKNSIPKNEIKYDLE